MNTGYLLMQISKEMRYQLNQQLTVQNMTVQQWAVIEQISLLPRATAKEIAQNLNMDNPTASGIVNRLEKKRLLVKQSNPQDKRSYLLFLTKEGQAYLAKGQKISDQVLANFLQKLSSAQQSELNHLLNKLIR
jgi:DNA-binding MarR family transcriptional regulator